MVLFLRGLSLTYIKLSGQFRHSAIGTSQISRNKRPGPFITERRRGLEASSGRIISELAQKERALAAEIEAAQTEAKRTIEQAEAESKRILAEAETVARQLATNNAQRLTAEQERIRTAERDSAKASVEAEKARAEGRVGQAVDLILKAVLP